MGSMVDWVLGLSVMPEEHCCLLCTFIMWLQESPHRYRTECWSRALEIIQGNPLDEQRRKLRALMGSLRFLAQTCLPNTVFYLEWPQQWVLWVSTNGQDMLRREALLMVMTDPTSVAGCCGLATIGNWIAIPFPEATGADLLAMGFRFSSLQHEIFN